MFFESDFFEEVVRMPMRGFRLAAIGCALAVLAACGGGSSNPGGGTTNPSATAYVALPSSDQVAVYRVDSSNHFTNIIGSPFTAGTAPVTVLVHPNNKFIYALNQGSSNISLFTTDNRTGVLTEVLPRTFTELSRFDVNEQNREPDLCTEPGSTQYLCLLGEFVFGCVDRNCRLTGYNRNPPLGNGLVPCRKFSLYREH